MPPKNITLGPGMMYIAREGEAPIPINGIQEVTVEPKEIEPAPCIVKKVDTKATFTATLTLPRTIVNDYKKWKKWVKRLKRLAHFARHGKNNRVRKKNLKRAYILYRDGHKSVKF